MLIGWLCLATTAVILAPALAGLVEETERFQIERMVDTTSVEGETESERDDFCHAECQATEGCEFWVRSDSTCFHMRDEEGFEEDAMLRKGVKYVDRFHDSQVRPACPAQREPARRGGPRHPNCAPWGRKHRQRDERRVPRALREELVPRRRCDRPASPHDRRRARPQTRPTTPQARASPRV